MRKATVDLNEFKYKTFFNSGWGISNDAPKGSDVLMFTGLNKVPTVPDCFRKWDGPYGPLPTSEETMPSNI